MITSPNEYKILEWGEEAHTNKQTNKQTFVNTQHIDCYCIQVLMQVFFAIVDFYIFYDKPVNMQI